MYGPGQEFHVIAAVVDRVPPNASKDSDTSKLVSDSRKHGSEGISVCILDSEIAAPDLWAARDQPIEKETMSVQQQCTISFILQPAPEVVEPMINETPLLPVTSRSVQLPVANTLFHNGKTSTLLAQRWIATDAQESESKLRLTEQTTLPQQSLNMSGIVDNKSYRNRYALSIPMIPITPPRIVATGMGNIVRTLQMDGSSEKTMPASTELENVVARHSETQRIHGIWAQVTPGEKYRGHPQVKVIRYLQTSIDSGSRLHKVIGGGGGWGNKQGLLALDPDSEYSKSHEASEIPFADGNDIDAERLEILGQVVKPGDVVQFWASIQQGGEKESMPIAAKTRSLLIDAPRSVVLGVIPDSSAKSPIASPYILIWNQFGMLSEHGMSMKIITIGPKNQDALGADKFGFVGQTKLDMPYARLTIIEQLRRRSW